MPLKPKMPVESMPEPAGLPRPLNEPIYRLWRSPFLMPHPITGRPYYYDVRHSLIGAVDKLRVEQERRRRLGALAEYYRLSRESRWIDRARTLAVDLRLPWVKTTWVDDATRIPIYALDPVAGRKRKITADVLMAFLVDFESVRETVDSVRKALVVLTTKDPFRRRWGRRTASGLKNWVIRARDPSHNSHLRQLERVGPSDFGAVWETLRGRFSVHSYTTEDDPIGPEMVPRSLVKARRS